MSYYTIRNLAAKNFKGNLPLLQDPENPTSQSQEYELTPSMHVLLVQDMFWQSLISTKSRRLKQKSDYVIA